MWCVHETGCGKFALRALSQCLAREFQPQGVHVAHIIIDGFIGPPRCVSFVYLFLDLLSLFFSSHSYSLGSWFHLLAYISFHHISYSNSTITNLHLWSTNISQIRCISVSDTYRVRHRHDTDTYNYTKSCDFFKLLTMLAFSVCVVSVFHRYTYAQDLWII